MDDSMTRELFEKIAKDVDSFEEALEDYLYRDGETKYGFEYIDEEPKWEDEGKYSFKYEKARLVKYGDNLDIIERYDYGIERAISRTGSYYSDYYYEYYPCEMYSIEYVLVPQQIKVIPEHLETKWNHI
jgi:hypothetical protein